MAKGNHGTAGVTLRKWFPTRAIVSIRITGRLPFRAKHLLNIIGSRVESSLCTTTAGAGKPSSSASSASTPEATPEATTSWGLERSGTTTETPKEAARRPLVSTADLAEACGEILLLPVPPELVDPGVMKVEDCTSTWSALGFLSWRQYVGYEE
jgi:hypothetical protein